jgi:glycosyltransferase involved in cell wall biosynthesis
VVGRADPRKQTGKLIEAFASLPLALRDSLSLVVACRVSEEILEHWHSIGRSFGLGSDKLKIVGLVSDDDLRLLYSTTSLFVEPSIYEGFGLPAAEAAACGAVTITSNVSSLPEVLADPHAVFDPRDTSSLVSLMTKALTDQEFRQQRLASNSDIANRHSWVDVATRSLRVFSSVARQASLLS